ncbi:hypothetical protein ALC56_06697, partial [Trachymyrmex septentrionalis]
LEKKDRKGIKKLYKAKKGKERRDGICNVEDIIKKMRGKTEIGKEKIKRRNSVRYEEEIQKRKRGELEKSGRIEEEIFKRSRLTERTPERKIESEREGEFREGYRKQENRFLELIEEIRKKYKNQRRE